MERDLELVFENESKTMAFYRHASGGYYRMVLTGRIEKSEYRQGFEKGASTLVAAECCNLLIDASTLTQTDPEARAWLLKRCIPETVKQLGHMDVCVISPKSTFQKMAIMLITKALKALRKPVDIQYYDSAEEAADWVQGHLHPQQSA